MYTLEGLLKNAGDNATEINGKWAPARPMRLFMVDGLISRAKDAWEVFRGRADAFTWPMGQ